MNEPDTVHTYCTINTTVILFNIGMIVCNRISFFTFNKIQYAAFQGYLIKQYSVPDGERWLHGA